MRNLFENIICKLLNIAVIYAPKGVTFYKECPKRPLKMIYRRNNTKVIESHGSVH